MCTTSEGDPVEDADPGPSRGHASPGWHDLPSWVRAPELGGFPALVAAPWPWARCHPRPPGPPPSLARVLVGTVAPPLKGP